MLTMSQSEFKWGYVQPWGQMVTTAPGAQPGNSAYRMTGGSAPRAGTVVKIVTYMASAENYRFFVCTNYGMYSALTDWIALPNATTEITGLNLPCQPGDTIGWWCGGTVRVAYTPSGPGVIRRAVEWPEVGGTEPNQTFDEGALPLEVTAIG